MTVEEWYALDKKPGMKFRTPDGKIGKLVSVHKDGATLDFTNGETYTHVVRSFYRCVQLSQVDELSEPQKAKPKTQANDIAISHNRNNRYGKVMRVKTGDVFNSPHDAQVCLGVDYKLILRSCMKNISIVRGTFKGESFKFV